MIEIQNLSKQYENASQIIQEVLLDINLTIELGDSIAIVGPSGSGKSTLLNLIGSLDIPSSGDIMFEGKNINQLNEKEVSEFRNTKIGFVFQQHHLLPQLTLLENVLLPTLVSNNKDDASKIEIRAKQLLKKVGLEDKIDQSPSHCSVGECQRAAVVRALINQPKVILADEPTGSLDEQNASELVDLLSQINKDENVSIVMVTHSLELASKMKKVYKLSNKKLVLI
ncbi:MAG: ABC transporter ATP-binding protein [Bacteroidetes bacterium]|jgi:lipoprotein-releasing system ATP-binding protein|nr:ABC transporter ATP-binding protein [Bacteroidota bacterium]MBT3802057.1 ABC transporter ATP-binding protein [Bacteroidota bacterium]MBT4339909.1 ABC transporter ATP-binding protein [Bacteroidota bacterium]MBT4970101.1 ABC transporter ATP-binding protein [Bacteroidota bacterium]MBT5992303.1 ABC transporter ATP-binding protein [Bacteroidota bacterium]